LIIHSENDEIIPYGHGESLYAAAAEPKAMLTLDAPHIGGNFSEVKQQGLLQFFNQQCHEWLFNMPATTSPISNKAHMRIASRDCENTSRDVNSMSNTKQPTIS